MKTHEDWTMTPGIYGIHCIVNDTWYVGSSIILLKRKDAHIGMLRRNAHYNRHLQSAYLKYGEENFEIHILERIEEPDSEKLVKLETSWIKIKDSFHNGFNQIENPGAYISTEFDRKKLGLSVLEAKQRDESKRHFSNAALQIMIQRYLAGDPIKDIAKDIKCKPDNIIRVLDGSHQSYRLVLEELGWIMSEETMSIRALNVAKRGHFANYVKDWVEDFKAGLSFIEIAKKYKEQCRPTASNINRILSRQQVEYIPLLDELNFDIVELSIPKNATRIEAIQKRWLEKGHKPVYETDLAKMIEELKSGQSLFSVCTKLGFTYSLVRSIFIGSIASYKPLLEKYNFDCHRTLRK